MQSQQEKRRRKPTAHVPCEPVPNSLECELWHRNADESPFCACRPSSGIASMRSSSPSARSTSATGPGATANRFSIRGPVPTPARSTSGKDSTTTTTEGIPGGFYAVALGVDQDAWASTHKKSSTKTAQPLPDAFTPWPPSAASSTATTAALPFALNAWSFENARIMERYLLREKRLTLLQRRAISVLIVSDDLPTRAMEKYLGGLRAVVWKDGKTFQRWSWRVRRSCSGWSRARSSERATSSRIRGAWHLYE